MQNLWPSWFGLQLSSVISQSNSADLRAQQPGLSPATALSLQQRQNETLTKRKISSSEALGVSCRIWPFQQRFGQWWRCLFFFTASFQLGESHLGESMIKWFNVINMNLSDSSALKYSRLQMQDQQCAC